MITFEAVLFIIGAIFLIIGLIFSLKTNDIDYFYISLYDVFIVTFILEFVFNNYLKNEVIKTTTALILIVSFTLIIYFGFYLVYKKEKKS